MNHVYYIQANSGDLQIKTPLSRIQEGYNFSYNVLNKNKPEKNQIWSGIPGDLNFNIKEYDQYNSKKFIPYLSIIDLIFNNGPKSKEYI